MPWSTIFRIYFSAAVRGAVAFAVIWFVVGEKDFTVAILFAAFFAILSLGNMLAWETLAKTVTKIAERIVDLESKLDEAVGDDDDFE